MALKAGYKGLKDAFKFKLEKLIADTAGMKIVKTIGNGLSLSDAGTLDVTAASDSALGGIKVGDNLHIDEHGVLSASGGGAQYVVNTEVDTGKKFGGKTIYGLYTKFFSGGAATQEWSQSGAGWACSLIPANAVDTLLNCEAFTYDSGVYGMTQTPISFDRTSGVFSMNFSITNDAYLYLEYTKQSVSRKK